MPRAYRDPRLLTNLPKSAEQQFEEEYEAWGRGTRPEFIVWRFLTENKHLVEGVDFDFQSSRYGGRRLFGGIVIDFYIPFKQMVWRVQGEQFHMLQSADRIKDEISRVRLEQEGFKVIDLWVRDIETRPDYILNLAWEGKEPPSARSF